MSVDMKRRVLLKGTLAAGILGTTIAYGLLVPREVLAAWPKEAFEAKKLPDSIKALHGEGQAIESENVEVKVPEIAENGAVVPVSVKTNVENPESISVFAINNPVPLVASFKLGEGAVGYASTRIKMGKTGDVVAVVKADGKMYSARKTVKVTIGGCGG